ncbi:MAG TPA: MerR family transcriptional regulator [Candidatus Kapabacteria bacterium]|jgi:DNA-binding transcriptional MerR regulator|nr:MerR family transcriptional regulator [Candidatus Kapabacteria bacterium]
MKDLQIKKLYYSISEVSRMVELEQYVLRYWETEFEQLRPQKNRAGNRAYTEKDIELIRLIKRLTREQRFTIEGARQVLNTLTYENGLPVLPETAPETPAGGGGAQPEALREDLLQVRRTLEHLLSRLGRAAGTPE